MSVKGKAQHDTAPHYVVVFHAGRKINDRLIYRGRRVAINEAKRLTAQGYKCEVVAA